MIQPGTLLQNRYRVAKQIGAGGMGAVYVATDERFQSTVAIKRTFFDAEAMRKAFEREAQLLNHLRHAALPKVSDHFYEGEGQFLVMEFIEGTDLSELMKERKGAFPVADVLRWADELLDALDYLHTHEPAVVHRDIKPQNLKLTTRGQIVLLDFGLAKGMPGQTHSGATASVFGYSPNFAPLEQMQGTGTDPRSDLYSLAATLYYLMTGALPADALTRAGATVKNQPDPLRPAHLAHAQVTAAVGKVIQRAMSQNAALRPPSAKEMRAALRQAANAEPRAARPARQSPQAHAPTVFAQGRSASYDATMVEEPTQSPDRSELAAHDSRHRVPRHAPQPDDSYTTVARRSSQTPSASASSSKILGGAIVALLIACVVAASVVLIRGSAAAPSNSAVKAESVPNTPADAQTTAPAATQPSNPGTTPNAIYSTAGAPASQQATASRPADEATSPTDRPANGKPDATGLFDASAGGGSGGAASDEASRAASASSAAAERPALVINNPAPAETRPTEDEARRAEEFSGSQPRHRPEERYGPPPDGRRPPPPDGRRPPPHRPPPHP